MKIKIKKVFIDFLGNVISQSMLIHTIDYLDHL